MTLNRMQFLTAAAALALAVSGTAVVAGGAGKAGSETAQCEIFATKKAGMVTLEGVVHAKKPVSGSYSFRVASSGGGGSSDVSQGGDFSARPGEPATVGHVMLGGSGAVYEATLEVKTPDGSLTCRKRVGAAL